MVLQCMVLQIVGRLRPEPGCCDTDCGRYAPDPGLRHMDFTITQNAWGDIDVMNYSSSSIQIGEPFAS